MAVADGVGPQGKGRQLAGALFMGSVLWGANFWGIALLLVIITGMHYWLESTPYEAFHHIPVTLYLLPLAWTTLWKGWRGTLSAGLVSLLVTVPSLLMNHSEGLTWLAEIALLLVTALAAGVITWRVGEESRLHLLAQRLDSRLVATESRYQELFQAAGDPIILFTASGQIQEANRAFGLLVGQPLEAVRGEKLRDLFPAEDAQVLLRLFELGKRSEEVEQLRLRALRSDGSQVPVMASCVMVAEDVSTTPTVQAILRDTSFQEQREQTLRSLVQLITQAQEEERRRIAQELHDDTLQGVTLLLQGVDRLLEQNAVPPDMRPRLESQRELAANMAASLRRFSRDLRPSMLDELGLVPALQWLTGDMRARTGLEHSFEVQGEPKRLDSIVEVTLFRVVQEAIRNVEKHAQATSVKVLLMFEPEEVCARIEDDGRGFAPPKDLHFAVAQGKLGLVGLYERASRLDGTLSITSEPGKGTVVDVHVPLALKAQSGDTRP